MKTMREFVESLPEERQARIKARGAEILAEEMQRRVSAAGPKIDIEAIAEEGQQAPVRVPHWTDHVTKFPIFHTVIDGTGPRANMISIGSAASAMLHRLKVPRDRIEELTNQITMAESYEDAIALVEKWFKVDRGDGA